MSVSRFHVIELTSAPDLVACEAVQLQVWRPSASELVPASQLRAAQLAGGLIAAARMDGETIGFCYGFPAFRPEISPKPGLHSHMAAVLEDYRGLGVGKELKYFQRRWCAGRGLGWIEWTFDPLRPLNARFNLEHLGATAAEYLCDVYGKMTDALNAGLPSDRLMVRWTVENGEEAPMAPRRAGADDDEHGEVVAALKVGRDGYPERPLLGGTSRMVTVAVPEDIGQLMAQEPDKARRWRLAVREAMTHYLSRGYVATRFLQGSYLLEKVGPERNTERYQDWRHPRSSK